MSEPLYPARYSDGRTAAIRSVRVSLDGPRLTIVDDAGNVMDTWPTADIRLVGAPHEDGTLRLCRGSGDARLSVNSFNFASSLEARCPDLRRPVTPSHLRWQKIVLWSAAAVAGLVVFFFVAVPLFAREIVRLTPPALEARAGAWMADYLITIMADPDAKRQGKVVCERPDGQAALQRLVSALNSHATLPLPPVVQVVNSGLVNAFALPGGRILIFRGLLEFAVHANEVAGVLAHELAHAEHRHPLQIAIEQTSGAFVVGLLFGDAVGFSAASIAVTTLLRGYYSRGMETEADDRAVALMRAADISTLSLAAFFERLSQKESDLTGLFSLLSTHPELAVRAERLRNASHRGRDALTPAEFVSLRNICR